MVRSLDDTYQNALEKVALDRDLSHFLSKSRNQNTRDVAWKIARCADDHNVWFICDSERGWLHGRFWKCNHKLCSFCLSAESRKRRRRLLDAIEQLPQRRRRWHFVTFTIENPAATIMTTRRIVNDSWLKLRRRRVFAEVRACAKSEEFTVTKHGFHYHVHTLLDDDRQFKRCEKIPRELHPKCTLACLTEHAQQIRREWTECVEASDGTSRNLFGFQTYDGFLRVDFRRVLAPKDIVNELGKYITKSTSFRGLSRSTLNELAEIKRWHRMFELLGDLREPPKHRSGTERASSVHTKNLSRHGEKTDLWYFNQKRADARYFMYDVLESKYASKLYDLPEMRDAILASNCDITAA